MQIGERLRQLRISRRLSQGDIEKRTGLIRCYTSRVENGHTIPTIDTLEKYARALEVPMYKFFYDGAEPPAKVTLIFKEEERAKNRGKDFPILAKFIHLLAKMQVRDRGLLVDMARRMAVRTAAPRSVGRPRRKRA
jgi:transcriptional regulator with XRE-family HTH domain